MSFLEVKLIDLTLCKLLNFENKHQSCVFCLSFQIITKYMFVHTRIIVKIMFCISKFIIHDKQTKSYKERVQLYNVEDEDSFYKRSEMSSYVWKVEENVRKELISRKLKINYRMCEIFFLHKYILNDNLITYSNLGYIQNDLGNFLLYKYFSEKNDYNMNFVSIWINM